MFYKVNLNFHEDMQRSASMICENESMHGRGEVRLSPIGDSYGHLNPKWVVEDLKSVFNIVPIWESYFGLSERHDPNTSIISPGKLFAEIILFWVPLLERMSNGY